MSKLKELKAIEGNSSPYSTTSGIEPRIVNSEDSTPFAAVVQLGEEKLTDGLSTDLSSITFSNHTGAIRSVQLHQSERLNKAYDIEHSDQPLLGIAFEDESGALLSEALPNPRGFRLIESSPSRVVYRWESPGNLSIDRIYERSEADGYGLIHKTVFRSLRDSPMVIDRVRMYLGSSFQIPRMYNPFDQASTYLSVGYYNEGAPLAEGCSCATCSGRIDGEREEFFQLNEMGPSGKIEPRRLSKAKWACVNNQFFVNLLRPESELNDFRVWGESVQSSMTRVEMKFLELAGQFLSPWEFLNRSKPKNFLLRYMQVRRITLNSPNLRTNRRKSCNLGSFGGFQSP